MLTASSPFYLHILQNASLFATTILFLPISTLILLLSYACRPFLSARQFLRQPPNLLKLTASQQQISSPSRTVLITGLSMTKALSLARTFHLAGHTVIGADTHLLAHGRASRSVKRFYTLTSPDAGGDGIGYIIALRRIIEQEHVDLWVSCSGVSTEVLDGQSRDTIVRSFDGRVRCLQLSADLTEVLHNKDSFVQKVQELGLPAPETHHVTSRDSIHRVLNKASPTPSPRSSALVSQDQKDHHKRHSRQGSRKSYILKPTDVNDADRPTGDLTILPRRTMSQTYNHLASIKISSSQPWVLQEYIPGKMEYCTHALIAKGVVKVFVACESAELLMHYRPLPSTDSLSIAMQKFTEEFASRLQDEQGEAGDEVTGHMSFDFLVKEEVEEGGVSCKIWPIECNPRVHTAVGLFRGCEQELANAYLSILDPPSQAPASRKEITANGHADFSAASTEQEEVDAGDPNIVTPSSPNLKIYWIGHDVVTLLLLPLLSLLPFPTPFTPKPSTLRNYINSVLTFTNHVLFWQDGTYELWDPLPAWWLYHIYWPQQLLACLWWLVFGAMGVVGDKGNRGKWSRGNVSTGKMFGC